LIWAADIKSKTRKRIVAPIHALAHLILMVVAAAIVSVSVIQLKSVPYIGEILYFLALSTGIVLFGFVGATLWGLYLTVACWFWKDETNNAFSAMRLDSYRHFIRLKIEADKITIYPIGIDQTPKREDWKLNESYEKGTQDIPVIVPINDLEQHLIENPIVIDLNKVIPLRSIK
jgi:hypothetical protein